VAHQRHQQLEEGCWLVLDVDKQAVLSVGTGATCSALPSARRISESARQHLTFDIIELGADGCFRRGKAGADVDRVVGLRALDKVLGQCSPKTSRLVVAG